MSGLEDYALCSSGTLYRLELEISGLPKRFNQGQGSHWTVRHQEAQKWHKRVLGRMVVTRSFPPKRPLSRARVTLIRYSSRAPDFDGLVQSFKPVMDALKKCLIILDDNMEVIGKPDYRWEQTCRGEGKIRILVEEVATSSTALHEHSL